MVKLGKVTEIKRYDTGNGPGIRLSVFLSGCEHRCEQCFNSSSWSTTVGEQLTEQDIVEIVREVRDGPYSGLSLLGGDPYHPVNKATTALFFQLMRLYCDNKDVWIWTGYTVEELFEMKDHWIDRTVTWGNTLVDGRFEVDKKDLKLRYCGSANQKVLTVVLHYGRRFLQDEKKGDIFDWMWGDWERLQPYSVTLKKSGTELRSSSQDN